MINGESIRIDDRDDRIIIFLPTRELTPESTRRLVPAPVSAALAVQTYRDAVELAFGDGGIGIAGALQPHVDGTPPDADFVRKALEPGVSSRIGGGGYGLTQLRETVEEDDGRLVIRSGSGQVTVESGSEDARNDCSPLPGTLVEVAFPT